MPIIDACMNELTKTGYFSYKGHCLVANYLARDLRQDWRYGAAWFEQHQIDHDYPSNYGQWNFSAGINNSKIYFFNIEKESRDFDPKGTFIRKWLPCLSSVPDKFIHNPWMMKEREQKLYNCVLGVDYPKPLDLLENVGYQDIYYKSNKYD